MLYQDVQLHGESEKAHREVSIILALGVKSSQAGSKNPRIGEMKSDV